MLAKDNRLTLSRDFENVKQNGEMFGSTSFSLALFNRKDKHPSRFGFVISTKVSPHATRRNFIHRILSEAMTQNMYRVSPGFDGVFLVKTTAQKKYASELMPEVEDIIRKAGLLK